MGLTSGGLPLLGGVAVLLLAVGSFAGSSSPHSLRYISTALSEASGGLPWFIAVGYVDDQPIARYDSHTREMCPQAPWMEKAGKEDPQYWDRNTQNAQGIEYVFRADLEILQDRFNQKNSTGQHTVQRMVGCEVGPDRRFRGGYEQHAYDGEDFLSLDLETLTYTARVPQAQETKRRWEGEAQAAQFQKAYLEETCVEWLRRYLVYGKEALQRTVAPTARVSRKKGSDGQEILFCHLYGFYPKEIEVTWTKDGEDRKPETLTGGVVPNLDGTYHTWLSIEVDPEERDRYRCHVGHDSLLEPLELAWKEPVSNLGRFLGILWGLLAALILVAAGVACNMSLSPFLCPFRRSVLEFPDIHWPEKRKEEEGYKAASGSDLPWWPDASTKISVSA